MERMLWQKFPPGEINEKIKFWIDIWDDLISYFTFEYYGFEMGNPHVILNVLVDELEHNELRNKELREYLLTSLGKLSKSDTVIKQHLAAEFGFILKSLMTGSKPYLLECTRLILPFFRKGDYFRESFKTLKRLLSEPSWKDKDEAEIEALSATLIVELVLKGYSLETIKDMPRDIFSSETDKFPSEFWTNYFDIPKAERKERMEKRVEEIQNLNLEKRLAAFERYFFRSQRNLIFIFEVEGLTGEGELQIGPVTFYSPKIRQFIKSEEVPELKATISESEFFGRNKDEYFCNAAVQYTCIDAQEGKLHAVEIGNKALDFLRSRISSECNLRLCNEKFFCLAADGQFLSSGSSAGEENRIVKWHASSNLKTIASRKELLNEVEKVSQYLFVPKENQSLLQQKVSDCLHWFRKGEESSSEEDRLLYYWIVLEKAFTFPSNSGPLLNGSSRPENKISLISELLSSTVALNFVNRIGWALYYHLSSLVNGFHSDIPGGALLNLPEELARKMFLVKNYQGEMHLKDFVANLGELARTVEDSVLKYRILNTLRFYEDGQFALEEIQNASQRTKDDILLIYRYRNSIVHNAHYDPSLLHSFVEKAASLAHSALKLIILESTQSSPSNVEQVFLSKHVTVGLILERLKKNLTVDFLEVPNWNSKRKSSNPT